MLYLQLFWTFLKIGTFTLGGGYAMIPLVEREVVDNRKWISRDEFLSMLALAQSAPGIIAVNTAIFVGYAIRGWRGVLFTVLGAVLPSFVIILLIAAVFTRYKNMPEVEAVMKGIRPAVVALIVSPLYRMAKTAGMIPKIENAQTETSDAKAETSESETETAGKPKTEWWRLLLLLIPVSVALLVWLCDISPVYIIILTIIAALAITYFKNLREHATLEH